MVEEMEMNLFKVVSFILAISAMIKVFFGIFYHEQLYVWARRHYAQEKRTGAVNLLLVYALALLIMAWAGFFIIYVPKGWIIIAFVTVTSLKSLNILFNWQKTSEKFVSFIDKAGSKLWLVDLVVGALGVFFLYLGIWVY
jgi:hypothetical protein